MSGHPRVARVITRLNIGGPAIQAIDLSRQLTAAGFHTCLIHGRLAAGEGDMTSLMSVADIETVFVNDLVRPLMPFNDARAIWKLFRLFCSLRPAIVHTHMAKAGTTGRLAAILYNATYGRRRKARLVHTYHGHVFEGYFSGAGTRFFLAVEKWLGRRTDTLIAISAQVRHDIVSTYAIGQDSQIKLVRLGFDLHRLLGITESDRTAARALLAIPPDAVVVTTVGRLTAIKQHTVFLRMAAQLLEKSGGYEFLIVGDGELRPELEAEAAALSVAPQVRFLGWRGDLEHVYGATDIFVLTSRNEGTPVALIEAMAAGVPSVSTDVGGVRDVIADQQLGTLVPSGEPNGLAAAVAALASSRDTRTQMGLAARAFVAERFDRERLVKEISDLYWHLLGNRTNISGTLDP